MINITAEKKLPINKPVLNDYSKQWIRYTTAHCDKHT